MKIQIESTSYAEIELHVNENGNCQVRVAGLHVCVGTWTKEDNTLRLLLPDAMLNAFIDPAVADVVQTSRDYDIGFDFKDAP